MIDNSENKCNNNCEDPQNIINKAMELLQNDPINMHKPITGRPHLSK